jgi:hypothetical protein
MVWNLDSFFLYGTEISIILRASVSEKFEPREARKGLLILGFHALSMLQSMEEGIYGNYINTSLNFSSFFF